MMAGRLQNVARKVLAAASMARQAAAELLEEEVADVAEDVPACFFFCMSRLGLTRQRLCDAGPGLWPVALPGRSCRREGNRGRLMVMECDGAQVPSP